MNCDIMLHEIEPAADSVNIYLRQRSFTDLSRGGLISVSSCFYDYVMHCERIFATVFESSGHETKLLQRLVNRLSEVSAPVNCTSFPKTKFLQVFVRMRIYYSLKFLSRNLKVKPPQKKHKKLAKIQHT